MVDSTNPVEIRSSSRSSKCDGRLAVHTCYSRCGSMSSITSCAPLSGDGIQNRRWPEGTTRGAAPPRNGYSPAGQAVRTFYAFARHRRVRGATPTRLADSRREGSARRPMLDPFERRFTQLIDRVHRMESPATRLLTPDCCAAHCAIFRHSLSAAVCLSAIAGSVRRSHQCYGTDAPCTVWRQLWRFMYDASIISPQP